MTIGELVQIFQGFAGKSWYIDLINGSIDFNPWIIYLNITVTLILFIILFLTLFFAKAIIIILINKSIYIDENGKKINTKDINPNNIEKYKKVFPADELFLSLMFFLTCCFILSAPIRTSLSKHHSVIFFHKDHLVLRKDHVYINNLFMSEKINYQDIYSINIYDKVVYRKKMHSYQCIFEFTMKNNKTVSFIILNKDMRKFKMTSCFPPGTVFLKSSHYY